MYASLQTDYQMEEAAYFVPPEACYKDITSLPESLAPLLSRILQGQNPSRKATRAITIEGDPAREILSSAKSLVLEEMETLSGKSHSLFLYTVARFK